MERVRKKGGGTEEGRIQRTIFRHFAVRGAPGVFAFHPRNAGRDQRGRRAGINTGLGVIPGVPDIIACRLVQTSPSYGQFFALELKSEKGIASDAQREVLAKLKACGAIVGVAHGLDAAIRQLEDWGLLVGRAT